jgi:MFS family permease
MVGAFRTWSGRLVARPWLLGFVPINAATAGFGVVLPLLILIPLHGSWTDVALAATLFNVSVTVSSVVWGHLSDTYPRRRLFLVVNYAGYAALYLWLTQVGSISELFVAYTIVGAIAPAGASASNLLILEKFTEEDRAVAFASFQEMSMIGSIVGLLIGYFWTLGNAALVPLLFVLAALALASAFALWFGIREAPEPLTTAHVARHPASLFSRLRPMAALHNPVPFFPHRPKLAPDPVGRFYRWARVELTHELPLILLASFLFNLAGNLFNISYTPFLVASGVVPASIFLVNLSNNVTQTVVFPVTGPLANRAGADRLARRSTYVRSLGYLATAALTFVAIGSTPALAANLAIYALLGGAIAVYTTGSSLMLFRALQRRDRGGLLGLNSALGGAAAVAGAALSYVLAIFGSFRLVFFVAAGVLLASLPVWTMATVAYERRRHASPSAETVVATGGSPPSAEALSAAKPH